MSKIFSLVPMEVVTRQRKEFMQISDLETYKRCRVQLHAKGVVLRDLVLGSEIKTKSQQVCRAGEFLVAEIDAKVGGFGIVPEDLNGAIVSSHYFLFEVDETALDRRFLDYYTRTPSFQDQVAAQGSTNYAAIRPADVFGYRIPLPPLSEQRRIVAHIEELANKIEEARGLRGKAIKETQVFVQAVCHRTFDEISRTWQPRPIKGTFKFRYDLIHPSSGLRGELCFVGLQHVESGSGRQTGQDFLYAESLDGRKFRFSAGEIVYGYLRPYLNKVWIANRDGICSVDQYVLQPEPNVIDTQYLAHYMRSPAFVEQANVLTNNLMLPRLRSALLESILIPVPPIAEQRRIVTYLDDFLAKVNGLKRLQTGTEAELDALLPSVLDKAFKGDL